jgi:PPK2 family polyphosphate:nucleotide phosphotransferase
MNYRKEFSIKPAEAVNLDNFDPDFTDNQETKKSALRKMGNLKTRINELQFNLYAEQKRSLLICLQGLDAAGKDGVIRHVIGLMNPQGCRVVSFKQPTAEELAHDFLWRIELQTPKRGEVVVFNRSQYEDVLIVRVHNLVPKKVWSKRFNQINEFERLLADNGTHILKFFLHISKEEQLNRFEQRLEVPGRRWKISEADYSERVFWDDYKKAYEAVLSKCSTADSPWFVIPANHKWFRDLVITKIIIDTLQKLHIEIPKPTVNIDEIRRKYHEAASEDNKKE